MSKFLVVGGAGYIGSHLVKLLAEKGAVVAVLDDLSTGYREAVPAGVKLYQGSLANRDFVRQTLGDGPWTCVFHFAALSLVGDSLRDPLGYFRANVVNTLNLIEECVASGVNRLVFSSTAAVYGYAGERPITEDYPTWPVNPYGHSKLMIEQMLSWADTAHGLRSACLRYFNAAGADPKGVLGESHHPETHLIPLCIDAALGRRDALVIFGDDYPTPDGTCVRDYVHVEDLARAHLACVPQLHQGSFKLNLGTSHGYSVRQVIDAVERVTGVKVPHKVGKRREGDPAVLVANSMAAQRLLAWQPQMSDLDTLVASAYKWRLARPKGYNT